MKRNIHVALRDNARPLGMLRFDAQGARDEQSAQNSLSLAVY